MASPIKLLLFYPNKWRLYTKPLLKGNDESLEFNWFICARPFKDDDDNYVIDVGRYSTYFNPTTGKSYYVSFDATEKKQCLLLLADHKNNLKKHSILREKNNIDENSFVPSTKQDISCRNIYKLSTSSGYQGFAKRIAMKCTTQDIVCEEAVFFFNTQVVEESKICPYIQYAKNHSIYLRDVIPTNKDYFDFQNLQTLKPGKDSLKIRNLLLTHKII